jgi:hypothetical protein
MAYFAEVQDGIVQRVIAISNRRCARPRYGAQRTARPGVHSGRSWPCWRVGFKQVTTIVFARITQALVTCGMRLTTCFTRRSHTLAGY